MKKNLLIVVSLLIVFIVTTAGVLSETGKSGRAGSPSESTCVSCHNDFPANSQGGSIVISSTMTSWQYMPGQTYTITVTLNETGKTVFGLCFESLKTADNTNAGTFTITHATETQIMTAGNGRTCVTHKMDGGFVTTPGSKSFAFNWTAPMTATPITFYVAGIAGDHDGTESGDNVYTTTHTVTPISVGVPELSSNLQVSFSPNPVKDILSISVNNINASTISAELYSITGSKVADLFDETNATAAFQKQVSMSSYAEGIYFIRINAAGKSVTKRIIIE